MSLTVKSDYKENTAALFTGIVFLTPLMTQLAGDNLLKLAEDIMYLLMLLFSVYLIVRSHMSVQMTSFIAVFIFYFLAFALLGLYYSDLRMIILQLRELKYLLLLIIWVPYSAPVYFRKSWKVIKAVGALSIPVSVIQWFLNKEDSDNITGLFGPSSSGVMSIVLLIIFFSELGLSLKEKKRFPVAYFLYLIPTALNETKITLVLFPVLFFTVLLLTRNFNLKIVMPSLVVIAVLFLGWSAIYKNTYHLSVSEVFSYDYLKNYLTATDWMDDAGRLAKINYALTVIKENMYFGYGLGASYLGATTGLHGFISKLYYTPQMFGGTRPQLFVSLIETGVMGTSAILTALFLAFIKVLRARDASLERFIAVHSIIIVFICLLYQQVFYFYQVMYMMLTFTILTVRGAGDGGGYGHHASCQYHRSNL